jgi:hypothetical protein
VPLDSARLEELKSNLALARKRPLAFELCLGKSPETTVLLNHKTKDPETVGRLAKKEGETSKVVFGMMSVGGKNLDLSIACDPIPGLARKTKEMLKAAGLKFKVRILDASGNLLEENSDDEDQDGPAPGEASPQGSAPEPDPQQVRWDETRPRVEAALDKAGGQADLTRARAAWGAALARASAGDLGGALQAADVTLREIATAVEARRSGPGDEAARWAAEAARLAPLVEAAMRSALPEAKKVSAYWDFAQSKAKAPVPDFGAVMKTLPLLEKLAREVLEKARRMTGTDTPAGGGGSSASPAGLAKSGKPAKPAPPACQAVGRGTCQDQTGAARYQGSLRPRLHAGPARRTDQGGGQPHAQEPHARDRQGGHVGRPAQGGDDGSGLHRRQPAFGGRAGCRLWPVSSASAPAGDHRHEEGRDGAGIERGDAP